MNYQEARDLALKAADRRPEYKTWTLQEIVRDMDARSSLDAMAFASSIAQKLQAEEDDRLAKEAMAKQIRINKGSLVFAMVEGLYYALRSHPSAPHLSRVAYYVDDTEWDNLTEYMATLAYQLPPSVLALKQISIRGIEVIKR